MKAFILILKNYVGLLPEKWSVIREYIKNNNTKKISKNYEVVQMDLKGNVIAEWERASKTKPYGFNPDKIYECCNGHAEKYKGFIWKYKRNIINKT